MVFPSEVNTGVDSWYLELVFFEKFTGVPSWVVSCISVPYKLVNDWLLSLKHCLLVL
jgi:hypothetical protein